MGNFSVFPTDAPTFVVGAFTLLKPDGLSESPTNTKNRLKILIGTKKITVYQKANIV